MTSNARKQGEAALRRGDWTAALAAFQEVLKQAPDDSDALMGCGIIHGRTGNLTEATRYLERAAALAPNLPSVHINLSKLALEKDDLRAAEAAARRAIALAPADANAHENLAVALKRQGAWEAAEKAVETGLAHCPASTGLFGMLGELHLRRGDTRGAIEAFKKASAKAANVSFLLAAYNYAEGVRPQDIFAVHREAGRRFQAAYGALLPPPAPPRQGLLKIGYVSPDMRDHSVAFFIEPIFAAHDRNAVDVYCYSTARRSDAVTKRLATLVEHWRNCTPLSDQALAELIRNDGIDVLVDLAGHTLGNRLVVFAMRAAPVQVTWLGYANTTGLKAMDFRLTDVVSDPPGADAFYTERLVRLPHGFLCYRPPNDAPTPVPPPQQRPFALASFNAVPKCSEGCIAAWAAILRRLPAARLRLKSFDLANSLAKQRLQAAFTSHGIALDRIELMSLIPNRREHLAAYHDVDLALDTFPYNGTTTTCEALWMGVPVLTLRGETHAGRVGASLLKQVGLEALIADNTQAYVEMAVTLADEANRSQRANWRSNLRTRMAQAPLCRPDLFVPTLERAYAEMAALRRAEIGGTDKP